MTSIQPRLIQMWRWFVVVYLGNQFVMQILLGPITFSLYAGSSGISFQVYNADYKTGLPQ